MRFVVTGEWNKNRLLRLILGFFLVYAALFWVTNFILYFDKMGLTADSVTRYYLGDEAAFTQPRSLRGMAEISHFHLFAMGVLVLTLTHLVLFVPIALGLRTLLVILTFSAALADELAGWGVRFVDPTFAYVKIAAFIAMQASLALLLVVIIFGVARPARNGYEDAAPSE